MNVQHMATGDNTVDLHTLAACFDGWDLVADTPEQFAAECVPAAARLTDAQRAELFALIGIAPPEPSAPPAGFCARITAPRPVTKTFTLVDGELRKETHATVTAGTIDAVEFRGLDGFARLLESLKPSQALCYGLPTKPRARLLTAEAFAKAGRPADALPRTAAAMPFAARPGVLCLDYDAPTEGEPLGREALVDAIRTAAPGLADAAMLWWPSTSSCIFSDGRELRGIRGQRLYLMVADASDIPRAVESLETRLWAAGFGRVEVSKSGSLLPRTLLDGAMKRPNQPDFAAGALCVAPVEQRRGRPIRIGGTRELIDTREALPEPLAEIRAEARAAMERARAEAKPAADRQRAAWIADRCALQLRDVPNNDTEAHAAAEQLVTRAVERRELGADWRVDVLDDGAWRSATVGEILDTPARFHGLVTRDPLEPDYDGARGVGKLFLYGARPVLHSMAHGGATFRLVRTRERIRLIAGRERDAVDATLEILRRAPDVFDFGGELVTLAPGRGTRPTDADALRFDLGAMTQFYEIRPTKDGGFSEVDRDPPVSICRQILALGERRELKPLDGAISAPTLRPDGTVLMAPGYDPATRLLLETVEAVVAVPLAPSADECRRALDTLWEPFGCFPFASPVDRGVMLAALLTACIRPTLETAPAVAFDAPERGSGKTLLAQCVAALATGEQPSALPPVASEDELRKRIFAALCQGQRAVVLDNLIGMFDSGAMAAALTSDRFSDRVLGHTQTRTVPNRALFVLSGNNVAVVGDMARRVLRCRIDAQTESPATRRFDFCPLARTLSERQALVAAGLTLIRGYLAAGAPRIGAGGMASFNQWERLVRQTVLWVADRFAPGMFADPRDSIADNDAADPERETLAAFLRGWFDLFGPAPTKVADLLGKVADLITDDETPGASVRAALVEWTRGSLSARSVGRALMNRRDRIAGGLRLEEAGTDHSTKLWRVRKV